MKREHNEMGKANDATRRPKGESFEVAMEVCAVRFLRQRDELNRHDATIKEARSDKVLFSPTDFLRSV